MTGLHRLLLALLPLAACADAGSLFAQTPTRRGTSTQIRVAREAFATGLAAVSRNPSAFVQETRPSTTCEVVISESHAEALDSLRETQTFDAGFLTTASRMSIAPCGGIILLTYATVGGAPKVAREQRRIVNGVARAPVTQTPGALVISVAETSGQSDVLTFTQAWTDLVQLCGGEVRER